MAEYWDDFKEGIKWISKNVPAALVVWTLVISILVLLTVTAPMFGLLVLQLAFTAGIAWFIIHSIVRSGRHSKLMKEMDEKNKSTQETIADINRQINYLRNLNMSERRPYEPATNIETLYSVRDTDNTRILPPGSEN